MKTKMKENIKETKEEILAGLEGISKQKFFYGKLLEAETKFEESLSELENYEGECNCEEPELEANIIEKGDEHYGDEWVCVQRCMKCGGYIKE